MDLSDEEKRVLEYMEKSGKPLRTGDIARALDMDSKVVSKVIKSLKSKGLVDSPKRCFYAPKQ